MLNSKKKKANLEKKNEKRKVFELHRNRNPKDNKFYRAYKQAQDEAVTKFQTEQEKKNKEDAKFGNKVKKFFDKFIPKIKPRQNYQRGR